MVCLKITMRIQESISSTSGSKSLIEVSKLTKKFDAVTAVDEISFNLCQGELFGFLGPNGAGKTTTINMLTGLARPDSGMIWVAGQDCTKNPKAAQHLIGVVPDKFPADISATVVLPITLNIRG